MAWRTQFGQRTACAILCVCLCTPVWPQTSSASASPVVLDRVIAIINGDVLLESDVREEMRLSVLQPISVPANQNTEIRAAQRLITRTLILRQMKEQEAINYSVSDEDVRKSLEELRRQIPGCGPMHCATEAGWQAFLQKNGLTEQEVDARWKERLEILKFIDQRFGVSIHISRQDIENYYRKNFLPAFAKTKQKPPTLESVAPRIREILLQQQVNSQLRDWLQSLREQGSVQILDPKYGQSTGNDDDTGGGA
ncbi:MAG TPA: peptidylprolyl isomerase [Pseudacidobacterium sp.]|nr:peptidylprolyl isomerase [Pseudacidobacterium sp.]